MVKAKRILRNLNYSENGETILNKSAIVFQVIDANESPKEPENPPLLAKNPANISHLEKNIRKMENDQYSVQIEKQDQNFVLTIKKTYNLPYNLPQINEIKKFLETLGFLKEDIDRFDLEGLGIFYKKVEPLEPEPIFTPSETQILQRGNVIEIGTHDMYYIIRKLGGNSYEVLSYNFHLLINPIDRKIYKSVLGLKKTLLVHGIRKEDVESLDL